MTAVYPYIPTSNRNSSVPKWPRILLYILIFLHQTATLMIHLWLLLRLYILIFLHQTATLLLLYLLVVCCISLYSYIKPQQQLVSGLDAIAVYPYIPTSNRNEERAELVEIPLYILESTLKSGIIDYSDCTTTDFWTAMVIEFDSIKCQVLIRM